VNTVDRAALDERIRRSWDELQAAVASLDDAQLAAPGAEGWSIKDHLAHLAHWEEYLLASLDGSDPLAALGLPADQADDTINAALQERDAGMRSAEVRSLLADTHARLLARLATLDDEALQQSLGSIEGNTREHFDEHRDWIRGLRETTV
jgi:uncharacterized protein (TIGR03083 family)